MNKEMKQLVKQLHEGKHSCVILTARGDTYTCNRRGVADLYEIYRTMPEVLEGATVADKVIGKGAAALLALQHLQINYDAIRAKFLGQAAR